MSGKKKNVIKNLGSAEKLTVQKSIPLFSLWKSELTLSEFKILDTYLARINSHEPDRRVVEFSKGELEEKLGVKKINKADLTVRLKHLMGNVVELPDQESENGMKFVTLFESAEAWRDDSGSWIIRLECTRKALKYFFNIENLGYLRYKLHCITSLTSRYSYIMFLYLEKNRYRRSWNIRLHELKVMLNCEEEGTYKEYKHFNNLILKKVQKELSQKTDLKYLYTPIKTGRSVTAIQFAIEDAGDALPDDIGRPSAEMLEEADADSPWVFLSGSLSRKDQECEFTSEQLDEILQVLVTVPDEKLPENVPVDDIQFKRYHYLAQQFASLNRMDAEQHIKNRFAYFIKMLRKDACIG